jgi:hypothetical protein
LFTCACNPHALHTLCEAVVAKRQMRQHTLLPNGLQHWTDCTYVDKRTTHTCTQSKPSCPGQLKYTCMQVTYMYTCTYTCDSMYIERGLDIFELTCANTTLTLFGCWDECLTPPGIKGKNAAPAGFRLAQQTSNQSVNHLQQRLCNQQTHTTRWTLQHPTTPIHSNLVYQTASGEGRTEHISKMGESRYGGLARKRVMKHD